MQSERKNWLDIARGIAICLVILGHSSLASGVIYKIIFSFHMPLFFFISGYVFRKKRILIWVENRSKRLFVPLFFWSIVITGLFVWIGSETIGDSIYVWKEYVYSRWFIYALFEVELVLQGIFKAIPKDSTRFICVTLVGVIGHILCAKGIPGVLYWSTALAQVPMMYFGICAREYIRNKNDGKRNYFVYFVVAGVINIAAGLTNESVNVRTMEYGNVFLYYIAAISGIIVVVSISKIVQNNLILEFIGRNTLTLYLINEEIPVILHLLVSNWIVKPASIVLMILILKSKNLIENIARRRDNCNGA